MKLDSDDLRLSAGDLANYLACRHLTDLDLARTLGRIGAPQQAAWKEEERQVLFEAGMEHENTYLRHLEQSGKSVERPDAGPGATERAMRRGADVIVQASLRSGRWFGRADLLRRVERRSELGAWSYEVVDTKLSRNTKAGTILQLCLYSDLVASIQGVEPHRMFVVSPRNDEKEPFVEEEFLVSDFAAYYRLIRRKLEDAIRDGQDAEDIATYPDPVPHCELCAWQIPCLKRRRADDDLSLVADLGRRQRRQFREWGLDTLAGLGSRKAPLPRPDRGSPATYEAAREQARVQLEGRKRGKPYHELLPREEGRGLALLPEPSPGDLFFDIEGARFVGPRGFEYLFGWTDADGEYYPLWAFDPAGSKRFAVGERRVFENFVDTVMERRERHPDMHLYHYGAYEPSAVKHLMGHFDTRGEEVDRILRARLFVDLHTVVRQSLRASVERYSIKDLEPFYGFERGTDLRAANDHRHRLERLLETGRRGEVSRETLGIVEAYNRDDCASLIGLRDWLEALRSDLVAGGEELPRPEAPSGDPSETVAEEDERLALVRRRLLASLPEDPSDDEPAQRSQRLLASLLGWHRREKRASWWEFFRLKEMSAEDLRQENKGLTGLKPAGRRTPGRGTPTDIYRYESQDTTIRAGEQVRTPGGEPLGTVAAIDTSRRQIEVKKHRATEETHPETIYAASEPIRTEALEATLERLGNFVAERGLADTEDYAACSDLLLRRPPRGLPAAAEDAVRLVLDLDRGVLPIQGPPGTGKTRTGAAMICALVRAGKKVGITATSHAVIGNLLDATAREAARSNLDWRCVRKVGGAPNRKRTTEESRGPVEETTNNAEVLEALSTGEAGVAAGTAWMWSREEFASSVDVLFVDEAGQMSLANTLAGAHAASTLVLLGDPQQLDQPLQGSHPEGADASALGHLLGDRRTMPSEQGLFLARTWRLNPSLCRFTSEVFYEGALEPAPGLERPGRHSLSGAGDLDGAGLRYLPVEHEGNQSASPEEAVQVAAVVSRLLGGGVSWTDREGNTKPLTEQDLLIVSPYNAQLAELRRLLPDARLGTVDKFQGQEAPVVFYSMATSSAEDAPRGMDFLYSLNRLDVATSRAQCLTVLVLNPKLFEPECRTPHQMRLANALCRYRELARPVPLDFAPRPG